MDYTQFLKMLSHDAFHFQTNKLLTSLWFWLCLLSFPIQGLWSTRFYFPVQGLRPIVLLFPNIYPLLNKKIYNSTPTFTWLTGFLCRWQKLPQSNIRLSHANFFCQWRECKKLWHDASEKNHKIGCVWTLPLAFPFSWEYYISNRSELLFSLILE